MISNTPDDIDVRIPRDACANARLSLRAIGLLTYLCVRLDARPASGEILSGWPDLDDNDVIRCANGELGAADGLDSTRSAIRELQDDGYVPHLMATVG